MRLSFFCFLSVFCFFYFLSFFSHFFLSFELELSEEELDDLLDEDDDRSALLLGFP